MLMRKNSVIFCFLFLCFHCFTQVSVGYGYSGALPLSDFNKEGYKFGNGYDFYLLSNSFPRDTKFRLQIGLDFNQFYCLNETADYRIISNGSLYNANFKSENEHFGVGLKLRLTQVTQNFNHHIDVDFGARNFYTNVLLSSIIPENKEIKFDFLKGGTYTSSYTGITFGSMYKLKPWLYLDLYTRMDFGKNAYWYNLSSIKKINNDLYCDIKNTSTPFFWFGASLCFQFNFKNKSSESIPQNNQKVTETPQKPKENKDDSPSTTSEETIENSSTVRKAKSIGKTIYNFFKFIEKLTPKKTEEPEKKR